MDGYVSKPVRARELLREIAAAATQCPSPATSPEEPAEVEDGAVFDLPTVLARLDGDRVLLEELVGLFQKDSPRLLGEIDAALERGDAPGLYQAAHTLKGSLNYFAAGDASAACQRLEALARRGALAEAEAAYQALRREIERLAPVLQALAVEAIPS
jgi:HPt (histidine-containing phosphotransfer) domain-containing protein